MNETVHVNSIGRQWMLIRERGEHCSALKAIERPTRIYWNLLDIARTLYEELFGELLMESVPLRIEIQFI